MTLTALVKLSDRFGEAYFDRINEMLKPYETSCVLQAQQRACEYAELLKNDYSMIREQLLDRMPPLDIDNAKARRADEEEGEGEYDEDEYDEDDEPAPRPARTAARTAAATAPAASATSFMDDLLGMDMGGAQTSSGVDAFGGNDFSGVMNMLDTISMNPVASPAPMDDPFAMAEAQAAKAADPMSPFDILDLDAAVPVAPTAAPSYDFGMSAPQPEPEPEPEPEPAPAPAPAPAGKNFDRSSFIHSFIHSLP